MIPIEELKVGDIVWSMGALHPLPSFVSEIHEGAVWLSENKKPPSVGFCNNIVFRTYEELMLAYWEPKVLSGEAADQELKDAVSQAYNSGVGSFSVGKSEPSDIVHRDGDKWYFWDETLAYRDGPYDTEEEARDKMQDYAETVLGYQPTNIQTHGSFEHSDGTLLCTPGVRAPTANDRLSIEHLKKVLNKNRKPGKTFAQAMVDVTKVMKKLGDTLGSVKNPCGEIPLESTPPETDSNEFVEALKPNGLMERDCLDEATECYQCNVVSLNGMSSDEIKKWSSGACVCEDLPGGDGGGVLTSRSMYNSIANARFDMVDREIEIHVHDAAKEAEEKEMKAMREAAEGDSFTITPMVKINITDEMRESVKKGLLQHWNMKEEPQCDEASSCNCGGPDGHLPGGSHCRKPL